MTVLVVTGTGTGGGKTVVTAALVCAARHVGLDVAVCKPVQTGTGRSGTGDDDLAEIGRLTGERALHGLARYPEPMAPRAAADAAAAALPTRAQLGDFIAGVDRPGRLTLVEGAGGLLVELADDGATLRTLAADLAAPVLVVASAGLGTLNHTALTVEALQTRGVGCAGLAVGAWPAAPGMVDDSNRVALAGMAPLRAVLPERAATLPAARFAAMSADAVDAGWLTGLVAP